MKIVTPFLSAFFVWIVLIFPHFSSASDADTQVIMQNVLDRYLTIQQKLADDTAVGVEGEAQGISKQVGEFFKKPCKPEEASCASVMLKIQSAAQSMKGTEIKSLRKSFQELSAAMIEYWEKFNPKWPEIYEFRCPLADDNKGASWMQRGSELKNPYLGHTLPKCGIPAS
jgi:Cu(I)/Ag(I) efflux system membrane fusion protein